MLLFIYGNDGPVSGFCDSDLWCSNPIVHTPSAHHCLFISCLRSDYNTAFPTARKSQVSSDYSIVVIIVSNQTLWLSLPSSFKCDSIRVNRQHVKVSSALRSNGIDSNRANIVHIIATVGLNLMLPLCRRDRDMIKWTQNNGQIRVSVTVWPQTASLLPII